MAVIISAFLDKTMATTFLKPQTLGEKSWVTVNADGQTVGRLAARIARILMGKTRPSYTPHAECGDGVIVTHCAKVRLTGNKPSAKTYKFYSGYPSGLREVNFESMMKKDPTYALYHAVKGMLPKSRLGKRMITRLLLYPGAEHPHQAQKPRTLNIKD